MPAVSPDVESGKAVERRVTKGVSFASFKGKLGELKARSLKASERVKVSMPREWWPRHVPFCGGAARNLARTAALLFAAFHRDYILLP